MRNGREIIWAATQSGRSTQYSFDRLLAEDYNTIIELVGTSRMRGPSWSPSWPLDGPGPSTKRNNLPSRDGVRVAGS
jgi:hypothetical protein